MFSHFEFEFMISKIWACCTTMLNQFFFFTDESSLNKCQLCLPIVQKGSTFFQQSSRWAKKDTLHAKCQNNVPLCQNNVPLCQKCNAMTKYYIAMPGYSTATPIVPHQCWTPHHCNYRRNPFFGTIETSIIFHWCGWV